VKAFPHRDFNLTQLDSARPILAKDRILILKPLRHQKPESFLNKLQNLQAPIQNNGVQEKRPEASQAGPVHNQAPNKQQHKTQMPNLSDSDLLTSLPAESLIKVIASLPAATHFLDLSAASNKIRQFTETHASATNNARLRINFPEERESLQAKLADS
jgi:hypothetical protein